MIKKLKRGNFESCHQELIRLIELIKGFKVAATMATKVTYTKAHYNIYKSRLMETLT